MPDSADSPTDSTVETPVVTSSADAPSTTVITHDHGHGHGRRGLLVGIGVLLAGIGVLLLGAGAFWHSVSGHDDHMRQGGKKFHMAGGPMGGGPMGRMHRGYGGPDGVPGDWGGRAQPMMGGGSTTQPAPAPAPAGGQSTAPATRTPAR
jgi:hypothetical protein